MNVNDVIAERVEAARRRIENQRKTRAALAAARSKGLARRHAQKLRHLAERGHTLAPATPPNAIPPQHPTNGDTPDAR